ncbi:hypothetical protein E2C01_047010 [Portunus trituberculatus]|uniref:Uncharacterized protein n=1 Tax=Portunus trituberculatus TaxID=210409 RepID=A0A5B7G9B6_PORTR|nr:hypothetical protein [Portunus trituberculatus]
MGIVSNDRVISSYCGVGESETRQPIPAPGALETEAENQPITAKLLCSSQRSAQELEQRLQELKNKNLPTLAVQSALLMAYIRGKEVEKAETFRKVRRT